MKKRISMLVGVAALAMSAAFIPSGAQAHHCAQTNLFLFTFVGANLPEPAGTVTGAELAQNNLVCTADPDDEVYDTRLIKPGSVLVAGRLQRACAANATLPGTVSGLGYDNEAVTFACSSTIDGTPGTVMDTADVPIDQLASGTITLTVTIPDPSGDITLTTCYHTIDAACPDMPGLV